MKVSVWTKHNGAQGKFQTQSLKENQRATQSIRKGIMGKEML